jgi:tetratricopeptide (TPR) repeat protein/O-antigen ligase
LDFFKRALIGLTVTAIAVTGPGIAADYGGVLHWTQYVAAVGVLLLGVAATILSTTRGHLIGVSHLGLLLPILLWAAYGWFQCIPLAPRIIETLSPASFSAYVNWLEPLLPEQTRPDRFPISIAPDDSRHAASVLTVVPAFLCVILVVFRDRNHVMWGILVLAATIGLHAIYGMIASVFPAVQFQDSNVHKVGFGTYINNNNMALLLNTGIASGLAVLASRWDASSAVNGSRNQTIGWRRAELLALDPVVWVAAGTLLACFGGLLMCGSRSGLAAILIGGTAAYLWRRRRDGWLTLPAAAAVVCLVVLVASSLLAPFAEGLESIAQFKQVDLGGRDSAEPNLRLQHWPDGFRAAVHYLPAGSGLSTYAYAYLPFQNAASDGWFHHADNLWLELLVEQGIPGVLLALATAGMVLRALSRLGRSNDPIDSGCQVAGAYLLGCVAWSELFDFGLIIPGNLFSVVALWGLVISRSQVIAKAGHERVRSSQRVSAIRFIDRKSRAASFILCGTVIAPVLLVLPMLRKNAEREYFVQSVQLELAGGPSDESKLREQLARLDPILAENPVADLYDLAALLNRKLARVRLIAAIDPANPDELSEALEATEALALSASWHRDPGELPSLPAEYSESVRAAHRSLARLPLGIKARGHLLALQFANEHREQGAHSIEQLAELQKGFAERLLSMAAFASATGNEPTAARLFRQATAADPFRSDVAVRHALADPERTIADYIAEHPVCQRLTSKYLLENTANDPSARVQTRDFLKQSVALLDCASCRRSAERSKCEEIAGGAFLINGEIDLAVEHFRQAIELMPGQISLRRNIIQRLIDAGQTQEAIELATQSYAALPHHFPFKVIADQLRTEAPPDQRDDR